jgi:hypothetical protein
MSFFVAPVAFASSPRALPGAAAMSFLSPRFSMTRATTSMRPAWDDPGAAPKSRVAGPPSSTCRSCAKRMGRTEFVAIDAVVAPT